MTADFGKVTVKVNMLNLAALEGAIDGNTFEGTKVTETRSYISASAPAGFTGMFRGAWSLLDRAPFSWGLPSSQPT